MNHPYIAAKLAADRHQRIAADVDTYHPSVGLSPGRSTARTSRIRERLKRPSRTARFDYDCARGEG